MTDKEEELNKPEGWAESKGQRKLTCRTCPCASLKHCQLLFMPFSTLNCESNGFQWVSLFSSNLLLRTADEPVKQPLTPLLLGVSGLRLYRTVKVRHKPQHPITTSTFQHWFRHSTSVPSIMYIHTCWVQKWCMQVSRHRAQPCTTMSLFVSLSASRTPPLIPPPASLWREIVLFVVLAWVWSHHSQESTAPPWSTREHLIGEEPCSCFFSSTRNNFTQLLMVDRSDLLQTGGFLPRWMDGTPKRMGIFLEWLNCLSSWIIWKNWRELKKEKKYCMLMHLKEDWMNEYWLPTHPLVVGSKSGPSPSLWLRWCADPESVWSVLFAF